jgi:ATP-dependent helicase/nuclease subunit B
VPVTLIPFNDDPLARLGEALCDIASDTLPDLGGQVVLLPEPSAAPALRQALLASARQRGHDALLGPRVSTLHHYVLSLPHPAAPVLGAHARELLLTEALQRHPALIGGGNPWRLTDSLLSLFDELTLNLCGPDASLEHFTDQIRQAYGIDGDVPAALGREAALIHTLWQSWHSSLAAEGRTDAAGAYVARLTAPVAPPDGVTLHLVGFDRLHTAEAIWCRHQLAAGRMQVILQGTVDASETDAPIGRLLDQLDTAADHTTAAADIRGAFLDAVFGVGHGVFADRARKFAGRHPDSPLGAVVSVCNARSAETEARAIDIQVRRWLLAGRRTIGIVTEDRRLARRVRALLERAGLTLQDDAGWALTTTRAAASLERWLECVEEDFPCRPLLDLLKSPFMDDESPHDERLITVYRFEQDLVRHEGIARGLTRYRDHLKFRGHRLKWAGAMNRQVEARLETLAHAAAPLLRMVGARGRPPGEFLEALIVSLQRLGLWQTLQHDDAGIRIIETIEAMHAAARSVSLPMHWLEFRGWLGNTLEHANFRPPAGGGPVRLLSLSQSPLVRFDAVVIAGANAEHLPGGVPDTPFFNHGVRRQLGIPDWRMQRAQGLYRFRRLLEAAPEVLITACLEERGQPLPPSPWVEALTAFHRIAYGSDLASDLLAYLVNSPAASIASPDTASAPPVSSRPAPGLTPGLLPATLSVAAHQRLIDCPYRFFAADCLGLKAPEEIRLALEKSDYGSRVHQILAALHHGAGKLPGPFDKPFTAEHRGAAIVMLTEISRAVFAADLEDNFEHRGWLQRWLDRIPAYIDWQIERARDWRVEDTEHTVTGKITAGVTLKGRLDRLDRGAPGFAVIDYKTGAYPSKDDLDTGEDVQLTSYALLVEDVTEVSYLDIDKSMHNKVKLSDEALADVRDAVGTRLHELLTSIADGAALPAWSDSATCGHCDMSGICRRDAWQL